jgi:hypothetical protein
MKYEFGAVETCDMCGSRSFRFLGMRLSASQGRNPKAAEGIAVPVKSCRCGLVFADPQPIPENIAPLRIPARAALTKALRWLKPHSSQCIRRSISTSSASAVSPATMSPSIITQSAMSHTFPVH